jgi:hypothetical protein
MSRDEQWPELDFGAWAETCQTLHLWSQIVGKVRNVCTPWTNHSWHVTLYPTPRGLTTAPMSYGTRVFEISFDFFDEVLRTEDDSGSRRELYLPRQTVASVYEGLLDGLDTFGIPVRIHGEPNELEEVIPFAEDDRGTYDGEAVRRFHHANLQAARLFQRFRSRFLGKCSPVHFFWGSFDLAVTRFSGRPAPEHPGGFPHMPDPITREAYSHEVSSAGFFPGSPWYPKAAFYSYAYPSPEGFDKAEIGPAEAGWDTDLGEFVLPYDAVRAASDPDAMVLEFLQSTYEAAAELADWDRAALERPEGPPSGFHLGA